MTDYIQRDTAIELMKKEAAEMSESFEELGGESGIYAEAYEDAANMLQDMPAADVAEVVRCEGCKHSYTKNRPCDTALFRWCRKWDNIVRDCDFCSYGERRGDNVSD